MIGHERWVTDCIGHMVSFFLLLWEGIRMPRKRVRSGTKVSGVGLVSGSQEPRKLRVIVKQQSKSSLGKVDPVVDR